MLIIYIYIHPIYIHPDRTLAKFITSLIHIMDFESLFLSCMIFSYCFMIDLVIGIFEWHYLVRLWLVLGLPMSIMDISSTFF